LLFACGSDDGGLGAPITDLGFEMDNGSSGTDTAGAPDTVMAPDLGAPPPDSQVTNPTGLHPNIVVDPMEYTFSYISPLPEPLQRQIIIANSGKTDLVISNIEMVSGSSPNFIIIAKPPLPKVLHSGESSFTIVVFKEVSGTGTATLRISSNDPESPEVDVALSSYLKGGSPQPEPCVGLQPNSLNFGNVVRGQSKTMTAYLSNCGQTDPLTLNQITGSGFLGAAITAEFEINPAINTPQTILPGDTVQIDVIYSPLLAGPDFGSYYFNTDDPNEPSAKLDVSGIGVAPPIEELGLSVKLSWDANSCDVDSHLIAPGGGFFDCTLDCHFGNPSPVWGDANNWIDNPFLDVDDVDGYGPEHINISEPAAGTYKYVVHYYSDQDPSGFSASVETNATVEVYSFGQLLKTFGPVHLDQSNRNWDVFTIDWPSLNIVELGNTYMVPQSAIQSCSPFPFPF
jgi:hypothetical protein